MSACTRCPICGCASVVVDSRTRQETKYRRRKCTKCHYRWSTIEIIYDPDKLIDRRKRLLGIKEADTHEKG